MNTTASLSLIRPLAACLLLALLLGCAFGRQMRLADEFYEKGDYDQALAEYLKAEQMDPQDEELQEKLRQCRLKIALIAAGDFYGKGEYERSLAEYRKADNLNPLDNAVKQKITECEGKLTAWADRLHAEAGAWEKKGYRGVSMLLLATSHRLTGDANRLEEYRALRNKVVEEHTHVVSLSVGMDDPDLSGLSDYKDILQMKIHMEMRLNSIRNYLLGSLAAWNSSLLAVKSNTSSYRWQFQVMLRSPYINRVKSTETASQQYVSDTKTEQNAKYLSLENDLAKRKDQLEYCLKEQKKYQDKIGLYYNAAQEAKRKRYEDNMKKKPGEPQDYQESTAELMLKGAQFDFNQQQNECNQLQNTLTSLEYQLSYTPKTITTNIYSTHTYPVEHHQVTCFLPVDIFLGNKNIGKKFYWTYNDSTHEAQPVINLAADPLKLPADIEAIDRAYKEAGPNIYLEMAPWVQAMPEWIGQEFSENADKEADPEKKLDWQVLSCFADPGKEQVGVIAALKEKFGKEGILYPLLFNQSTYK